jgi:hypothetical protein
MALGTNTSFGGGPLVFLTPRSKDKEKKKLDKPYFSVARVDAEGHIQQTEEQPTSVSGDLVSIDIKVRKFRTPAGVEEERDEVSLYLRDAEQNETYRIPNLFSIPSRGLFNSVIGLKAKGDFTGLKIDFYRNKKGFEAFALEQRGEKVPWAFKIEELPAAEKITDRKGNVIKTDFSDVDEFFKKHLLEISEMLGKGKKQDENGSTANRTPTTPAASAPKPSTTTTKAATPAAPTPPPAENLDDSIPF